MSVGNDIAAWCNALARASGEAEGWVERNTAAVGNEKISLLKDLRRAGRLFRTCAKAAARKMCVGVFGPSQSGKSYLISALARGANDSLNAVFGNACHDFLSEINPEGGKEATGLVTRFTLSPSGAPDGYPVKLELLSEIDLVKIIANTYYADCEHKEKRHSDIAVTLGKLHSEKTDSQSAVDINDMEDLRGYIAANFMAKPGARELEQMYWEEATELGPRLNTEGRIRLYALIWDEVEEFTALLRKLLSALEKLGYPETCYCAMDALIPRADSIIDVATLTGAANQTDHKLDVVSAHGVKHTLPASVLTALAAELTIVMAEEPAGYFEYTDLLDFPGYRSRFKLDDVRRELKKPGMLYELFLRGKVAFLFQRYCATRELNSMLLCIGPSNQEVQDLPGVINAWIAGTHGPTPDSRANKRVSLFLVLTKFDMEFEDKKGAPSLEMRWDNRLRASLLDFFGKQHDWPGQWTQGQPFNNIFMLRNPNFRFEAVMEFSGDTETGIRAQRLEYVQKLKNAFLQSRLVAAHFSDPAAAWQEAMRLNDGGISHIRNSLAPLCDPRIKREQITENVNNCRLQLIDRLKEFYHTDDRAELRAQKLRLTLKLFKSLGDLEKARGRLGQFLRRFAISEDELYDLHALAARRCQENPAPCNEVSGFAEDMDIDALDLGSLNPFAARPAGSDPREHKEDEAYVFASLIESKWVENMRRLAETKEIRDFYLMPAPLFSALISELATGAERLELRNRLSHALRKAAAYANTSKSGIARRQAAIASRMINDYIDWLGYNPRTQTKGQRSIQLHGGSLVTVFDEPPQINGLPVLAGDRNTCSQKWFADWLNALAGLIMDNINFDGHSSFDPVENTALGSIISRLHSPV